MYESPDYPDTPWALLFHQRLMGASISPLTDLARLYWPRYDEIAKPVHLDAMRGRYRARYSGKWRVTKMRREHAAELVHADDDIVYKDKWPRKELSNLIFESSDGTMTVVRRGRNGVAHSVHVWAASPELATQTLLGLIAKYRIPPSPKGKTDAVFKVLEIGTGGLSAREFETPTPVLDDADITLHYSSGFTTWNEALIKRLHETSSGLTLLEGPPGTGKTSYLRYLMFRLSKTHVFYFVPTTATSILSSPDAVEFWVAEASKTKAKRVVVLEDAEPLLMKRSMDNQGCVSNLLNIADGFLGDVLKLNLIATFNGDIGKLDPALMRPGRLTAYRKFERLTPSEAQRLADAKGITLKPQADYAIAEIYAATVGASVSQHGDKAIGFG